MSNYDPKTDPQAWCICIQIIVIIAALIYFIAEDTGSLIGWGLMFVGLINLVIWYKFIMK